MLKHVLVVVSSPCSKSYVGWMLHCWSMSWSKLVLVAWSRRVEWVYWLRFNHVLDQRTKWTDRVIMAKVCHALAHAKLSERIGEVRALPCSSCADISEGEAKALPCQSSALLSKQAGRPQLRLAVSYCCADKKAVAKG